MYVKKYLFKNIIPKNKLLVNIKILMEIIFRISRLILILISPTDFETSITQF